jgi:hypothetical protein
MQNLSYLATINEGRVQTNKPASTTSSSHSTLSQKIHNILHYDGVAAEKKRQEKALAKGKEASS